MAENSIQFSAIKVESLLALLAFNSIADRDRSMCVHSFRIYRKSPKKSSSLVGCAQPRGITSKTPFYYYYLQQTTQHAYRASTMSETPTDPRDPEAVGQELPAIHAEPYAAIEEPGPCKGSGERQNFRTMGPMTETCPMENVLGSE